jgi:cell division protein FtsW
MFLSAWGIIIIDRLEPIFANRQIVWLLLSVAAMLVTASLPHVLRWLRAYRYLILIGGIILLVSTILLGRNPSGLESAPQLWLGIGNVFFQPSEVLKVILVAFLASYLAEQYPALRTQTKLKGLGAERAWLSPRILGPILLMWSLSVMIVIWQRDLGTAALFFAVFLILLYIASGQTIILIGGTLLLAIAGVVAYQLFSVVELRVDIWLNPWPEADGRAYQIVQSLMAFGAGGIFGNGIGQGSPIYIPVVHSDFIFSAMAEEFGLLGVATLIASITVFVMRGLRIAVQHQNRPFYALLAVGFTMLISIQSLMIMSGILKLLPLTGVTLPFMSYGGSSLLTSYVITGLLLRLSAEAD